MRKKVCVLVLLFLLVSVIFSSGFVLAQGLEGIKEAGEKIGELEETIEEKRAEFLRTRWQEFFLGISVISKVDSFLKKINFVFIGLFSRNYEFSLELFFAIFLWFIVLLSFERYTQAIAVLSKGWQRFLAALAATVILAHIRLFNLIAKAIMTVIFLPSKWYWSLINTVLIIAGIVGFYYVNRLLGKYFVMMKQMQQAAEMKGRIGITEAFIKGVKKGV